MTKPLAEPFSSSSRALAGQVGLATLCRLFLNTSRRFVYPFAGVLAGGVGVPLTAITSLIALNQASGLLGPLFGPLGDRWGYRRMMLLGLGLLTAGMLAAGIWPVYAILAMAVLLTGLGKTIFDPALQAYIGHRVPYHRRGLAIGVSEFAWAGSTLVGIPLIGLLMERWGWQSPFWVLGGLGLASLAAMGRLFPPDGTGGKPVGLQAMVDSWKLLRQSRPALGAIAFIFLVGLANDNLFVVYGTWLQARFGLGVAALGLATTAIGLAELLGEGLTATLADRLGLKQAVLGGLGLSTASYALLPLVDRSLLPALAGLFLVFLTFEFTIVVSFSLFTEILPSARATLMSTLLAATSLGRMLGALTGGLVWLWGDMPATAAVSALISGLSLVCLEWGLRRWRGGSTIA